jgi:prepilin-type N-terminal cleavage/methylation domain-containing protein
MTKLRKAFTLIEILITISVLALLLSISFPAFTSFSTQLSLNSSAKALASELRAVQSQAVLEHKTLSLSLGDLKLPPGISPIKTSKISFSSSGCPPPGGSGTLILQNMLGKTRKIIVSSAGRVRIE